MDRLFLAPEDLLAIAPALLGSLGYSVTWGSLANIMTSVDGIEAGLGGTGRY